MSLSDSEKESLNTEIEKLLSKGAIEKSYEEGGHINHIFGKEKPDGTYRIILNLKPVNIFCDLIHFKMENISQVLDLVKQNCFMTSVDLKDAYYSIPIHKSHRKYLKFAWNGVIYHFVCLPNGYKDGPRAFTKILKPAFSSLREEGHPSVIYIDDSFLTGDSFEECMMNTQDTVDLLTKLGFTINIKKSSLIPSNTITFLGFIINSREMTISLTQEKKDKLRSIAIDLVNRNHQQIREVARYLGCISAAHLAVPYSKLFYRITENEKIVNLKRQRGNYDACMHLSEEAKNEIRWWIDNIPTAKQIINHIPPIDQVIYCDASELGWGAHFPKGN